MNENENIKQSEEPLTSDNTTISSEFTDQSSDETPPEITSNQLTEEELLELEHIKEERKKRVRNEIIEWTKTILFAIILYFIIDFFVARVIVEGSSMNPGIEDGDLMLVNKFVYKHSKIEYGDVIVFPYPNNPEKDYIKRVIAKEGDTIETIDGLVYVNGELIDESYLDPDATQTIPLTEVPEDTVYVLGDNRNHSSDSRRWGTVAEEDIIGKAIFTYWPINHLGIVK